MPKFKLIIKPEFKGERVGFAGSTGSKTLGERTQEELLMLAIIARGSGNKNLIRYFDGELPPLADLQRAKVDEALGKLLDKTPGGPDGQK